MRAWNEDDPWRNFQQRRPAQEAESDWPPRCRERASRHWGYQGSSDARPPAPRPSQSSQGGQSASSSSAGAGWVYQDLDKVKAQAFAEGVLKAEEHNGGWYVYHEEEWIAARDLYWCGTCGGKSLNNSNLESHIMGRDHRRRVDRSRAWEAEASASASASSISAPPAGGATLARAEKLAGGAGGPVRYKCPALKWLAWTPWDNGTDHGDRGLKCLLCNKWADYVQLHGDEPELCSKDHKRHLAGFDPREEHWHKRVTLVRVKWHPEVLEEAKVTAPPWFDWETWVAENIPMAEEVPPPPPQKLEDKVKVEEELPAGWYETKTEEGRTYYYTAHGQATWERPVHVKAGPIPPPPPEPAEPVRPRLRVPPQHDDGELVDI